MRADSAVASVARLGPLVVTSPLVIAFMPRPRWNGALGELEDHSISRRFRADSAILRQASERAGFTYVERYGPRIDVRDPAYNNSYAIAVDLDSVGMVLVAPGFPAVIGYGGVTPSVLREALESYAERIGRRPARPPTT